LARRQRLRAGVQPDGGRGDRGDLALADLAVDPLAEGRPGRRPQGDARALQEAPRRGVAEREGLSRRRGLRGGPERRTGEALEGYHARRVRGVPDASRLQSDRLKLLKTFLFLALASAGAQALAQNYPARPVRMLVGFTPGGGTDIMARFLAPRL